MKLFLFFMFIINSYGLAQVNLDRAYLGKTGNTLFYDLNDQNTIWAIPKYLEATPTNEVLKVSNEYHIRYQVSLPQQTLLDLLPQPNSPLVFRAFRATETNLEQITDIDPILKPKILPLGDIGMFGENIPYNLILQAKGRPNLARRTSRHLFDGSRSYLLGRINYFFSAIRSGQPYQAQSTVAILAFKKQVSKEPKKHFIINAFNPFLLDQVEPVDQVDSTFNTTLSQTESLQEDLIHTYNPQILLNSQYDCWNKSLENIICLKDN